MTASFEINGHEIGEGNPVYVVAEMSANHHQDFDEAVRILHAAKEAGANAVKLQTYSSETMTIECDSPPFRIGKGTIWEGRNLYELYGEAYTPWEWQPKLAKIAREIGLDLFSAPFDETAVDFLEQMNVPAYKVASFELVDLPLIRRVAATGKPMILSTGLATLSEIEEAVSTARSAGCEQLALLKCTSAYPAPAEDAHLRTIPNLAETFGVPVGISDHTLGIAVPIAAVALGACIIEKHFTLSRKTPGPDSAFSIEPHEFKEMVEAVRTAEKALGTVRYGPTPAEAQGLLFRRSLFVVEDMKAGEPFTQRNVRSIRPGYGMHTRYLKDVLGRRATRDIPRGTPLEWSLIGSPK